jgi:GT2 family glycosyltransferase
MTSREMGPSREASIRPLAVVIVTYKSHNLVERCLARVAEHLPELPVYVYENSGDDYPGREELAARHPEVHWVIGAVNLGYAAAANVLVDRIPADTDLLILDADARLLGPITRTRELIGLPGVAAVSPLVLDNSGAGPQPWDVAIRQRTLTRALVSVAGYSDSLRGTPFSQLHNRQPAESDSIDGYVNSSCLVINREAWNTIGGFDEEFFLYGDETEWQVRARAAGWRILLADELGVEHGGEPDGPKPTHGPAVGVVERGRNDDLLRANVALVLEHEFSVHHADAFLAGHSLLDRLQRSKRAARRRTIARRQSELPNIVITTKSMVDGRVERQKALLATELDRRGYPVTVVCLQRFGPLVKEIPHTVRVVRQPWWAPAIDIAPGPAVVIGGDTTVETRFAMLWRAASVRRRWLAAAHPQSEEDGPTHSRLLAAAMRRADGFLTVAENIWSTTAADVEAMTDSYLDAIGSVLGTDVGTRTGPQLSIAVADGGGDVTQ